MGIETTFRALDDLTRLRIVRLLAAMELAVGELAQVLGQSQPRISRHVGILAAAGLVERRREGSWVFLRQAAGCGVRTAQALRSLLEAAEGEDGEFARICEEDRRHLAAIRTAREKSAADYFARHADDWDRLRAIFARADEVEQSLVVALGTEPLGAVLDVGTGTGRIAELLEPAAERISAVDKSPEMLRLARARLQRLDPGRIDLVQGDFSSLPFADNAFDTVIFHQVLHYASDPEVPLEQAARVCRAGGRIAIVDLAAHDREDLRRTHAHARLGFDNAQLAAMLGRHGFEVEHTSMVEGGELAAMIWIGRLQEAKVAHIGSSGARRGVAR